MTHSIRQIPAIHLILKAFDIKKYSKIPKEIIKERIKEHVDELRKLILEDPGAFSDKTKEELQDMIFQKVEVDLRSYRSFKLNRVLNGTGTVLHTNLGRARLSDSAIDRVVDTSRHYSTLEYNIEQGARGSRHDIIQDLLVKATGSEAAMVVNNNAAAVYLTLRALAKNKEVVVSRGELVEIGGSFRVSTIMEESDAMLVEVGTTNKTHPYDYEDAMTENTGMLLKVHTSNFKTVGFTKDVSTKELKEIAATNREDIIVYEDLGSGSLYPFRHSGIGDEPIIKEAISQGADIISFSGDKLLGGPQAGIIAGKKELINRLKKHPLARVLRVDKMTLAALEATLHSFVYEKNVDNPTINDILQTEEVIEEKVDQFLKQYHEKVVASGVISTLDMVKNHDTSHVGGGTMPTVERPTVGISISKTTFSANQLEKLLRTVETPIISRMKEDMVFIDFRTIAEDEIPLLIQGLMQIDQDNPPGAFRA